MRLVKFSLVLVLLLVFSVSLVSADDNSLRDGRVNYWEDGAPVVVYCRFDTGNSTNPVFSGIELLRINSLNQGEFLLMVSATDLNVVGDQPATNTLLAEAQGFKLYRLATGEFYLTASADKEGKVYSFTWKRGALGC